MTEIDEHAEPAESGTDWGRRLMWAGGLVVVFVLATLIASATVPRWWAQRIGEQVDGSITQGMTLGVVYGVVFTFLPIVAIVLILRWRTTWKTIVAALVIGVVLALPNLMTLSIVLGDGNAAHAGDRILDVEAPAFRGGSLAGVVLAGLLLVFMGYLMVSRDRARAKTRRVEREREAAGVASATPAGESRETV